MVLRNIGQGGPHRNTNFLFVVTHIFEKKCPASTEMVCADTWEPRRPPFLPQFPTPKPFKFTHRPRQCHSCQEPFICCSFPFDENSTQMLENGS